MNKRNPARTQMAINAAPPSERDRIALLAFELPGEPRSPVNYAVRLASAIEERGLDVHLFCNKPTSFHRSHLVRGIESDPAPVAQARALCSSAVEHIGRVGQEVGSFTALHAIQWSSAPAVLGSARPGQNRAVVTFLDTVFSRYGKMNGSLENAQVRRLEQEAADECDTVLAGSEPVRQELAWLYNATKAKIITADAVECPEPSRETNNGAPRLVFIGSWDAAGGADLFVDTALNLATDVSPWEFVVGGDVVSRARLQADLRRRGQIELLARFNVEETTAAALAPGAIALVPARGAASSAPVFAAWRAGCPVIVTRAGPYYDVEDEVNGLRAFPFAQSLADAARALAKGAEQIRLWGEAGRRKVENQFTWPAVAAMLELIYREKTTVALISNG